MRRDRMVALVVQRRDESEVTDLSDLYQIGTAATVHQLVRGGDGALRLIVQGLERIRLLDLVTTEPYLVARVEPAPERVVAGLESEGLRRATVDLYRRLVGL